MKFRVNNKFDSSYLMMVSELTSNNEAFKMEIEFNKNDTLHNLIMGNLAK